jgi:hypothetical protein
LKIFEDRAQRRRFERKRNNVTGRWRELGNKSLHNLSSVLNIIVKNSRRIRRAVPVERSGEMRKLSSIG